MPKRKKPQRSATTRLAFTKKLLLDLPTKDGRYAVHDELQRDLGLRVSDSGRKDFFWFRYVAGRPTYKTIGQFPATSIEEARGAAQQLSGDLDRLKRGNFHPSIENPFSGRRGEPSIKDILEQYISTRLSKAKDPAKAEYHARRFSAYWKDWFGRKLSQVSKADAVERHQRLGESHGKILANRSIQLLRTLYLYAESQELFVGKIPTKGLEWFYEAERERFVQPAELPQFFATLKAEEKKNRTLADFIKLALFTSARKSDIFGAKWSNIDLDGRKWHVPNPKSRKPYVIELSYEAQLVLLARQAMELERRRKSDEPSEFVFRSYGPSGHVTNLDRSWRSFRRRAGIEDVHIHDLRRTLPSFMASSNVSLPIIGKHLGHASLQATQVYARLQTQAVAGAVHDSTAIVVRNAKKKPKLV